MNNQEYLSLDEKVDALKVFGDESLIDVFKDWAPARYNYRKKSAPLDQRVSVSVSQVDKDRLLKDLAELKASGEYISMSQFIRNRATGTIDLQEWKDIAEKELRKIVYAKEHLKELQKEKKSLVRDMDSLDEDDDAYVVSEIRLEEINRYLNLTKSKNIKRGVRLSGRTTFAEREIIVWRAQRLSLNISDYLRFAVFRCLPGSDADAHLSMDARQRFYISVMEVAENGFGQPPSSAMCSNCVSYLERISKLEEEVRVLRSFD